MKTQTSTYSRYAVFRRLTFRLKAVQERCDWRGWIALAWVLWFGWLYSLMVLETKFPQVLIWLRALGE